MAKVQAYVSDEIVYKINKIVERRRAEGAKSTDVSFSSISTMLLELGLRVYELLMKVPVVATGERMHLLLVSDTVSDNRRRFIFCKYCYDTQVHPPYGVNCV